MGVGGLDKEIQDIFLRAFSSRRIPASILQKYGISHVKGLLLYGPPGTGKTLIARQLAKVLHSKEPKIVNGPELFNKYVGETEAKVRGLFDDAKRDQQTLGTNSPLHVIIFDEFDSIAKHRGMDSSGTGVGDNVVNQLLAMIDGVEALENILVIGMTNRIDLIDKAVLRPGRFEVHIEIGLPDESGRLQILKIHTKNMASNNLLDGRVDQPLIAKMMKNYTGAEIEAVVKSASSFSLNRCHQLMDFTKNPDISQPGKVEMQDFLKALEEVKPEFGVDSERLEICAGSEFFDYGPRLSEIMSNSRKIIGQISDGSLKTASVLLYGPKGSGKTTLAAKLGLSSGCPFIKMVSSEDLIGKTEYYKTNFLIKTFDDAYKSPNALVILDDFERLVEYVDVRKSFNNNILQALLVLIKKRPSKRDNSICVLCTSSSPAFLREFEVFDEFNIKIEVPELLVGAKVDEVKMVIDQKLQGRAPSRLNLALGFRIPIKKLVFILSVTEKDKSGKAFDQLFEEALKVVNND